MSFANTRYLARPNMSIEQLRAVILVRRSAENFIPRLRWCIWLRAEITVPWPRGWTPQDHLGNSMNSADPNDWYREWLERHVGRQGWAWDWRVGDISYEGDRDTLRVKFRDAKMASWFALVWG